LAPIPGFAALSHSRMLRVNSGNYCQLIEKYKLSDDIPTVASRPDGHPLKDYGARSCIPTRMYDLVDALKETDAVKKEIKRRF
jgi:hypothetical protein